MSDQVRQRYTFGKPYVPGEGTGRRIEALILAYPWAPPGYRGFASRRDIVSVSLREGIDTWDDLTAEFGDFYILETLEENR